MVYHIMGGDRAGHGAPLLDLYSPQTSARHRKCRLHRKNPRTKNDPLNSRSIGAHRQHPSHSKMFTTLSPQDQRPHIRGPVFCNQSCRDSGSRSISALLGNPQIIVSEDLRANCLRAKTDALWQSVLAFGLELDTAAPWGWRRCSAIPVFGPGLGRGNGGRRGERDEREKCWGLKVGSQIHE